MEAIIGLVGAKETGKSTVAEILKEDFGFTVLEPGRQVMDLLLDINPSMVYFDGWEWTDDRVEDVYHRKGYLGFKEIPEGRRLLQELGTRIRHRDPEFWVRQQRRVIESAPGSVVHTSVRFPNEAKLIQDVAGQLWKVERRDAPSDDQHESELAWREIVSHRTIMNDGTLSDLRETVRDLIMNWW